MPHSHTYHNISYFHGIIIKSDSSYPTQAVLSTHTPLVLKKHTFLNRFSSYTLRNRFFLHKLLSRACSPMTINRSYQFTSRNSSYSHTTVTHPTQNMALTRSKMRTGHALHTSPATHSTRALQKGPTHTRPPPRLLQQTPLKYI